MRYLAILQPSREVLGADMELLIAEQRSLWSLYRRGRIAELHLDPATFAVVLCIEALDADDARAVLATLPLLSRAEGAHRMVRLGPWLPYSLMFAPTPGRAAVDDGHRVVDAAEQAEDCAHVDDRSAGTIPSSRRQRTHR